MIKHEIDSKQTSSLFVQLYKSIYYQKIDSKNIANTTRLVNKMVECLLKSSSDKHFCQDHVQIRGKDPKDGLFNT